MRTQLGCSIDQPKQQALRNPANRKRADIWWVEPDGSNAESVALDIAGSISRQGLDWFAKVTDLRCALSKVESQRDCCKKFGLAAFLAREVGDDPLWRKYSSLAEAEGKRRGEAPEGWLKDGYLNQMIFWLGQGN